MILITPDRPLTLNLVSYQPPAHLAAALPRFLDRTRTDGNHQVWTGAGFSAHRAPRIDVQGQTFTIFDYAYLACVDALWPFLRAVPSCNEPLCVAPAHLALRRAARHRHPVLLEADWDDLARRLYLTGPRRPHRHLRSEEAVGRVYEAKNAWFELARRNTRLAHSIAFDAPRIAVG